MDPLTHTATGWLLGRAGLNRLTPQAPWILMMAANVPDIDIVSSAGGSLSYLHYHRHLTHSLCGIPVMVLLPVLAVWLFSRRRSSWAAACLISLVAVVSHLLLDLTNLYGVRLGLPFSAHWFRLDITGVVDPWIWAVLLLAVLAPVLGRLVNQEIGANAGRSAGRGWAVFALVFLVLYNGGRAILHQRAVATLDARLYGGVPPDRVAALPDLVNPFRWRGLVETPGFYAVADCNLLGEFDPGQATLLYKPEESPAIAAARRTPVVQDFLQFAQYPYWRVSPAAEPAGGTRVEVMDLRFGSPREPSFVASTLLSGNLQVLASGFTFGAARPR